MQAAKGAALELQAPSTPSTSDATDIPRQLKSVNLDFSGTSLATIILHRSFCGTASIYWCCSSRHSQGV